MLHCRGSVSQPTRISSLNGFQRNPPIRNSPCQPRCWVRRRNPAAHPWMPPEPCPPSSPGETRQRLLSSTASRLHAKHTCRVALLACAISAVLLQPELYCRHEGTGLPTLDITTGPPSLTWTRIQTGQDICTHHFLLIIPMRHFGIEHVTIYPNVQKDRPHQAQSMKPRRRSS